MARTHLGWQLCDEETNVEERLANVVITRSEFEILKQTVGQSIVDVGTIQVECGKAETRSGSNLQVEFAQ